MSYASSDTARYYEVSGPEGLDSKRWGYGFPWEPGCIGAHAAKYIFEHGLEPVTFEIRRVRKSGAPMARPQAPITLTVSYIGFWTYTETQAKRPYDLKPAAWLTVEGIGRAAEKHFRVLCEAYPDKFTAKKRPRR